MQTRWSQAINPVLDSALVQGRLIQNIPIVTGFNVINHGLGKKLQGYFVVMNNAAVTFYDNQSSNQMPELTLSLHASGAATISLYVF